MVNAESIPPAFSQEMDESPQYKHMNRFASLQPDDIQTLACVVSMYKFLTHNVNK